MVDEELKQLDGLMSSAQKVKQDSLSAQGSNLQQLSNLYKIISGEIHEKVFDGLGLPPIGSGKNKSEVLQALKEHNARTISLPVLEKRSGQIPGVFMPPPPAQFGSSDPKRAVLAFRYGIQITKSHVLKLRDGIVDDLVIDFFLSFLEEYQQRKTTSMWREMHKQRIGTLSTSLYHDMFSLVKLGKEVRVDMKYEKEYLQRYDKLLIPVHAGFAEEYQLLVVNVSEFKIHHYHLCEIPYRTPQNPRQQLFFAWRMSEDQFDAEQQSMTAQRQKQQDLALQMIIPWIKLQASHFQFKQFGDMKLWRIRLENNVKVDDPRSSGLHLALVCSLMVSDTSVELDGRRLKQHVQAMAGIMEHVICQMGIGLKDLNGNVINYFAAEINSVIQSLRI